MGPVLVFGHRNPDNDSICSAVAYAHLKNLTDGENVYVPMRLGPVPRETQWVFQRVGVTLPEKIAHVRTRVRDVMTERVITVSKGDTLLDAGRLMREHGVRVLPVVVEGVVRGVVNERSLAERYIEETELPGLKGSGVTVGRLAQVLEGTIVCGDPESALEGQVLIGAMEPETMMGHVRSGDVLIVGDRLRTQPMAIEAGVACLVLSGGAQPGEDTLEVAGARGAAIISTPLHTFAAARRVNLAHDVTDFMHTDVQIMDPEMLLAEAAEDLFSSRHQEAVVVGTDGAIVGVLTRTDIARGRHRRVILVDHNEASQSAQGIEDATVVELVDHHRVGDIQTSGPILFLNMPVGSTATIVAQRYRELGHEIPKAMATLLLSAVLTDTVLLKSPTTTDLDRLVAGRLAAIMGVKVMEFGMEVFQARSAGLPFSANEIVNADLKEYRIGDMHVAVGQYETVDANRVLAHREDIISTLRETMDGKGYDLLVFMLTDIVQEGSEIFAVGKTRLVERGLGISLIAGSAWMDGVLSRKRQVAAPLMEAAGR